MADTNSFMAGKLRIPEPSKSVDEVTVSPNVKIQKSKSEPEKPWVGQSSIRELEKRNAERMRINKPAPLVPIVPTVDKVPHVPMVHEVSNEVHTLPIAPVKDFHRVSNSINREALEGGMFTRPSCKQVYDALYLLTRGAIQPSRTIQIGRKQLQRKAGIGSDKTLDAAVISLQAVGLLNVSVAFGSQKGNIYEVLLPEEIKPKSASTVSTLGTPGTNSTIGQKVPTVPEALSTHGTKGQTIKNKEDVASLKPSLRHNTKNDDDVRVIETFLDMTKRLDAAVKKITGRGVSKTEAEKWANLADLLILELEVAVSRADGVSSVPAFLTEVLRRQFFASRQQQQSSSGKLPKTKIDTVGKPESESYEIKPLNEKGREAALDQLREFAGDDFLEDFRKWYTPEDWTWLMTELEKK